MCECVRRKYEIEKNTKLKRTARGQKSKQFNERKYCLIKIKLQQNIYIHQVTEKEIPYKSFNEIKTGPGRQGIQLLEKYSNIGEFYLQLKEKNIYKPERRGKFVGTPLNDLRAWALVRSATTRSVGKKKKKATSF